MIWDDHVPENFKPPSLVSFYGKTNSQEHIISINNQITIFGTSHYLNCKLMERTFKGVTLRWYMSLLRFSITCYQDLTRKMVQHFSTSKHMKVFTTSMFNVFQGPFEYLRENME